MIGNTVDLADAILGLLGVIALIAIGTYLAMTVLGSMLLDISKGGNK
jgi:hypothetical protein